MSLCRAALFIFLTSYIFSCVGAYCSAGFRPLEGSENCVIRIEAKVDYHRAKKECSALGANLFDIKSWQDQRDMESAMKITMSSGSAWLHARIGNTNRSQGTYKVYWPSTAPVKFRLENFKDKNELQQGTGDCLVMQSKSKKYTWKRSECDAKLNAICVKHQNSWKK